nr:SdrD B-like domain-containing protein [Bacteroidia bacterium]
MKKLITLLAFVFLFGSHSYSQCFFTLNVQSDPCDSLCTGLAIWTFTGGQVPYFITINGTSTFSAIDSFSLGNLCPGVIYSYLVFDNNGDLCADNAFIIPIATPPDVQLNVVNATCSICNDGAVSAVATGGSSPYTYTWSNGSTMPSIVNLSPGIYVLYTTDANGCTSIDTAYVGVGNNGFYALQGHVYFDSNNNGIKDIGEPGVANQAVTVPQGPFTALSNFQGDYVFVLSPGTYDANFVGAPGWNLTSSPSTYNNTITTASVTGLDFGVFPDSTFLGA